MKKTITILTLAITLLLPSAANGSSQIESSRMRTLLIEVYNQYPWGSPEWMGTATAVLLNDGYVLTVNHVIGEESSYKKYSLTTFDGKVYYGELVKTNKRHDLALLKIDEDREGFSISKVNPYVKQSVYTVGNPIGFSYWSVREGTVLEIAAIRRTVNNDLYYGNMTSIKTHSGNSGGALINDLGELVGIIRSTDGVNSYAIMLEDIKEFLITEYTQTVKE